MINASSGPLDADTVAALKRLYAEDDAARTFFEWAAQRQNDATHTPIALLAQRAGTDKRHARELANRLAQLGCGQFVVGRRGSQSRIVWSVSLKSLGYAVTRGGIVESLDPDLKAEAADQKDEFPQPSSLTIPEAKKRLAETLGVSPDAIEITVRG